MHPFISTLSIQLMKFGILADITGNSFTNGPDEYLKNALTGYIFETNFSIMIILLILLLLLFDLFGIYTLMFRYLRYLREDQKTRIKDMDVILLSIFGAPVVSKRELTISEVRIKDESYRYRILISLIILTVIHLLLSF